MKKETAIVGVIVAFAGAYVMYNIVGKKMQGAPGSAVEVAAKLDPNGPERFRVPVGTSPARGPSDAKVTIVEFSDFQCPFCSRATATVDELLKLYGGKLRVVFKQNPLPFHPEAGIAAEAALAAGDQGKFWEMHDLLFKNRDELKRPNLEKKAQELGLDLAKFKAALDIDAHKRQIQADQGLAAQLGARGTPTFFINGVMLQGAQPIDAFKKVIDQELAHADKLLASGVSSAALYAEIIKGGRTSPPPPPSAPNGPGQAEPAQLYQIPVSASAPVHGPKNAKVTIIEFSDFQCPFCSRVVPTLKKIHEEYGDKVRVVWMNLPLPFHDKAMPAALAAMAAHEQGKFWEYHDKLFGNQQAIAPADLEKYAQELGLDAAKVKAAVESGKYKKQIAQDMEVASRFGARGTPTFFINGKLFRGAQPFEAFKAMIDGELKRADELLAKGTSADGLYAALIKGGLDKAAAPPPPPPQAGEPDPKEVYKVELGQAPVRGPKDAKVTIVEFSDFQCPFCSRATKTVDEILKLYPADVRVAFKHLPLPFHNNAVPAAEAANAAGEQGKFWEMHDLLFANQQQLDRPALEGYAQKLGLNLAKFKAALDSGKFKAGIQADTAYGNKLGARGTPTFFINGKVLVGAQPLDAFKARIEEAKKEAEAVLAKGVKPAKVYDELIKSGKTEVAAAPAGGGDAPPVDNKVYTVDIGTSPVMGPKNAKVTIVEFSDFQCPFCARFANDTFKKIKETYAGKLRIAFKQFPLPFHDKAQGAAEAALAAHAQGKFWEMHDKLFASSGALARPDLDRYAKEIGLDVARFAADMDSKKFAPQVEADLAQGKGLGPMGTPTFYVNGHKIEGALPFEAFKSVIDEALKKGS
jgi:protein-disulfide isomerase